MSWKSFSNDTKLNYCLDSLKSLLNQRKGITTSTPFTHQEVNATLKNIYTKDTYAGSNAFWNGGICNMIKSSLKNFILSATNPKFINMLLKDICNKFSFHGFAAAKPIETKRKREDEEEEEDEDEDEEDEENNNEREEELSLWKKRAMSYENVIMVWKNRALVAEHKLRNIDKIITS